jgi:gamma-glutamylcyclotransferase (GGCT)/AIG2-like uncharacterized protein YtfP
VQSRALSQPATSETRHPDILPIPATKLIEPTDYLWTYGTLQRGESRNQVLDGEVFEGEGYLTEGQLFDTHYGLPALFVGPKFRGTVWGEVYRIVHPAIWATLDRIENGLYFRVARRVTIPSKPPSQRQPLCQLYVANPDVFVPEALTPIPNGRWRNSDADAPV